MAFLSALVGRASTRRGAWGMTGALAVAAALLTGAAADLAAQTAPTSAYHLKAVFLFNFAQFVNWPPDAFPDSQAPLVIGVLGDDPIGALVDEAVRGERLGGRPFESRRFQRVEDIKTCHILFISQSEGSRVAEILASLKNRPILTVSDSDDFAKRGGIIQFVTDQNHIRLRINLEAAQAANLRMSSKLLRVAEIVPPAGR